jgi:hypothetical protein
LALTWPTSGGRSVGVVRSRTKATELFIIAWDTPIAMATRPEVWTVFTYSNTGFVGSNLIRFMDVCLRLFCFVILSRQRPCDGLILPTVYVLIVLLEPEEGGDMYLRNVGWL